VNIRLEDRAALTHAVDAVDAEVGRESAALEGRGRVLVRPSGTEPLVRVMVEAPTQDYAESVATRLAGAIERAAN
jgi:phosphoglucosamine mutase